MTHQIYFPPQYGNPGGWYACTVDQFGVWRCGEMYMPPPHPDCIK